MHFMKMFKKIIQFLSLIVASHAAFRNNFFAGPHPDVRIMGGQDADIKDYPYMLSMTYNQSHFCGAGLIDPKWAITAAHCLLYLQPSDIIIRANSSLIDDGEEITISRAIPHPKFSYQSGDSDIALLELSAPLICTNCQPVSLTSKIPQSGNNVTITGWGYTSPDYDLDYDGSPILQEAVVPIVDSDVCRTIYTQLEDIITDNMFCAGFLGTGGVDSCVGDSGSPVVLDGALVGVVSWGNICGSAQYPGVYTVVANYLDWIEENTGVKPQVCFI